MQAHLFSVLHRDVVFAAIVKAAQNCGCEWAKPLMDDPSSSSAGEPVPDSGNVG